MSRCSPLGRVRSFASSPARTAPHASTTWRSSTASTALFLTAASSWFEVSLHEEFRAGDHLMGLLRVHRVATADERDPLVWHGSGFRDLAALGSVDLG
ncbi:flavin reductase family protein [Pseudoclavibacter chungangensis]|uniref:flavin reductase family protein n=1 Tax=Pseudoclavibacter chungangensis TaxID=587635 RepID=UPI00363866D7